MDYLIRSSAVPGYDDFAIPGRFDGRRRYVTPGSRPM